MKPVTSVLLAGLLLSGCVHRYVTVRESAPEPEAYGEEGVYDDQGDYVDEEPVYEEGCDPVWDGHAFLVIESHIHGPGCGHWYHHGCWHLFPETHVYVEFGYSWCGDTGGFFYAGEPCARAWDGCAFVFFRGHVHGVGCGHFYHHGCWNTCERDHVFAESGHHPFSSSPPRPRIAMSADRVEGGGRERRSVRQTVAPAGQRQAGSPAQRERSQSVAPQRRAGQVQPAGQSRRVGQPQKREQPQRIEQPQKREQPQRIEQPQKREQPQRIEQPQKREQPQRIEHPQKREQPQRIEQPQKREQPQRIERPPKRESPPKREAPQRIEQPKKQDPPKQRDPEKKRREKP